MFKNDKRTKKSTSTHNKMVFTSTQEKKDLALVPTGYKITMGLKGFSPITSGSLARKLKFCNNTSDRFACAMNPSCCYKEEKPPVVKRQQLIAGKFLNSNNNYQIFVFSATDGDFTQSPQIITLPSDYDANGNENTLITSISSSGINTGLGGGIISNDIDKTNSAFIITSTNGNWTSQKVTLPILSANQNSYVPCVSTSSSGNGIVIGYLTDGSNSKGFVITQKEGVISSPIFLPSLKDTSPLYVSCFSDNNCLIAGVKNNNGDLTSFILNQINGFFDTSITSLNQNTLITCISTSSKGNAIICGLSDFFTTNKPFLLNQKNYSLKNPVYPTTNISNPYLPQGFVYDNSAIVCCSTSSDLNAIAGGTVSYLDSNKNQFCSPFVIFKTNGYWDNVITLLPIQGNSPVPVSLMTNPLAASVAGVSLDSNGQATAFGYYTDDKNKPNYFILKRINNTWKTILTFPTTFYPQVNTLKEYLVFPNKLQSEKNGNSISSGGYNTTTNNFTVGGEKNGNWFPVSFTLPNMTDNSNNTITCVSTK